MPILNGKKVTPFPGVKLKSTDALRDAVIQFDNVNTAPTTTSGFMYLYVEGGILKFDDGSATYNLLTGAGGGISSWDGLYNADKTLTLDSTTLTFALTHATNNGLTITGSAGSAGHCLQITNIGTGKDINGTSGLWSVTKAGLATFTTGSILGGTTLFGTGSAEGTISSNGAYDLVLETNSGTNSMTVTLVDAANGDIDVVMNGTGKIDMSGTTTHNTAFKVGAGDMELTLGNFAIISDWNTEATLSIQNDTATDIGSAADLGVMHIASESLTTGVLLNLSVDETGMAGGYFFRCYSQDAGAAAFTIGELGATVIAGSAVGTSVLTLTAGDITVSDGNVAVTSTSTSDVFSITDNSLLANNALIVKGSGVFTGTGASSFVAITPTGASTGTGLYVALAAATTLSYAIDVTTSTTTGTALRLTNTGVLTGVGAALSIIADSATTAGASAGEGVVNVSVDGLTTGAALNIESLSNELLTSGVLAHFDHSAVGTTIAAKTGALVSITSSMTESGTSTQDFDMVSIVRTSVHDTAGTLTTTGSLLYLENVATETGATLTDTVNGLEVVMDAQGTGTGVKVTHSATTGKSLDIIASTTTGTVALLTMNSLTTTGVGLSLTNTGTGMTSGSVLRVASGTTGAVATNGIVSLFATGAFTSTAVTDGFVRVNANSTLSGTAVAINGNSFTTGVGLYVGDTGTGMTSGSLIRAVSGTTGAVATNGLLSVQATGAYTSTANMGIFSVIADSTTAGTVASLSATSMVGGTMLFMIATAATFTGKYIQCYDGAADDFSVGQYGATIIAGNAGSTVLTVTAGDVSFADGSVTIADNDNAASVSITNDTASTIGAGVNGGVIDVSGDGLTTGTLLNLSVTEGTLAGGHYLKCWDVTAGVAVMSVEEDGEINVAGGRATTAGGADAINIGASAAIKVLWGSGAPSASAPQGSLYMRTDGSSTSTRMYVNTDGAGTWTAVTTAA